MTLLLSLSLALVAGLVFSRIAKFLHLPNVTGYLFAGLLIGPNCLNLLNQENINEMSLITEIALGFIAFSIGGEFKIANIKKIGKSVIIITIVQSVSAAILVGLALWAFRVDLPIVFTLAAIATATAPAATLMVVRQYKAHGPVTDTLLPVVAFDDAIGLIVFAICFTLAQTFAKGTAITFSSLVLTPIIEIALSIGIGFIVGLLLSICMRFFKSRANRLILMITSVIICVALCEIIPFNMSSLLVCMMLGATFCNIRSDSSIIQEGCERWTPPLFMLFFILSSAVLDVKIIASVGIIGLVYIIARSLGKYFGVFFSAKLVKAGPKIQKYLGLMLLPQAGVAIGMAQMASTELGDYGIKIMTVVLTATLIYELVGPLLTKLALSASGEIDKPIKDVPVTQK